MLSGLPAGSLVDFQAEAFIHLSEHLLPRDGMAAPWKASSWVSHGHSRSLSAGQTVSALGGVYARVCACAVPEDQESAGTGRDSDSCGEKRCVS